VDLVDQGASAVGRGLRAAAAGVLLLGAARLLLLLLAPLPFLFIVASVELERVPDRPDPGRGHAFEDAHRATRALKG